ncbi:hypothetical protein INT08_07755 [Prosthecochloris sp. N3]|uniref:Coiled coil domain-containing protein n=1 Tax=Prosthecochloris ethylica TaxID=2743976 RepID=A0ABR9XTH2_9CHLB|nr:hypothetical protein [Prosthecochloris ethylica]MBF0585934.1 hypothetical protein [Prosthecochloris ethylica]MBF0637061.1 hypothetical protein [Prosthecochloris ethylica]MEC9486858.1 hypothetical protein [Prosthecochloris sp.]NUK47298.1 hypothetical protein [Prosthecochloris ethylica]
MSDKQDFMDRISNQLNVWEAQIDKLKAQIDEASADMKAEYYKKLDELKERREEVKKQFEEVRHSGESSWENLKNKVEKNTDDLKASFDSFINRLKQ